MSWIFTIILLSTVSQAVFCHGIDWFALGFILNIITRCLFFARLLGATIKAKNLIVTEGIALGLVIIFNILSKKPNDYLGIIFYILCSAIVCLCMFADDTFWLYVTEDYDEKKDEE